MYVPRGAVLRIRVLEEALAQRRPRGCVGGFDLPHKKACPRTNTVDDDSRGSSEDGDCER
jgi:hypothetical protein